MARRELEAWQGAQPPDSPDRPPSARSAWRSSARAGQEELGAKYRLSAELSLLSVLRLYLPSVVLVGTLAGAPREAPRALT